MTNDRSDGKEFEPGEHADQHGEAASTHGSGKQFTPDVDTPESDEQARQTEGSGKGFSPTVDDPEEETDAEDAKGSGKQFAPRRDDQ